MRVLETLQEWAEIWQSQVTENLSPESPGSGSNLGGEGLARPPGLQGCKFHPSSIAADEWKVKKKKKNPSQVAN